MMILTCKLFNDCLWIILLLTVFWINSCTHGSSITLTVEGGVSLVGPHCPGTVRLFCEGVDLTVLRWRYNGNLNLISYFPDGEGTTQSEDFFSVQLTSAKENPDNPIFGNFSSLLAVNLSELQSNTITEISCSSPGISQVLNVSVSIIQPNAPSNPTITMVTAEYHSGVLSSIEIYWTKPENFCGLSLDYIVNLTTYDSVRKDNTISQSNCVEELCGTSFTNLSMAGLRTNDFVVSLRADNEFGSSEFVYYPIIITHQVQQNFVLEVFVRNNLIFGRCTSAEGFTGLITGCSVQHTTDPMYINLSAPIQVPLDTDVLLLERPVAERTYYFLFSANVNNSLQITDRISFTVIVQTNTSSVVTPVVIVVLFIVIIGAIVIALLVVMMVIRHKPPGPNPTVTVKKQLAENEIGVSVIHNRTVECKWGRRDEEFKIVVHRSQDGPYVVLRWWSEFDALQKKVQHLQTEELVLKVPKRFYNRMGPHLDNTVQYQEELREFVINLVKIKCIQDYPLESVEQFLALDKSKYEEQRHEAKEQDQKGLTYVFIAKDNKN